MKITKQDLIDSGMSPNTIYFLSNMLDRLEALESKGGGKFKKPTVMDVQKDMHEKGCVNAFNEAESFINYFEQVGWVVGQTKKPMKSWKAAVNNWLKNKNSRPAPEVKAEKVDAMRNIHDTNW